ncbi:unnamed protein product, partial [Protopolystoma xenopodis]
ATATATPTPTSTQTSTPTTGTPTRTVTPTSTSTMARVPSSEAADAEDAVCMVLPRLAQTGQSDVKPAAIVVKTSQPSRADVAMLGVGCLVEPQSTLSSQALFQSRAGLELGHSGGSTTLTERPRRVLFATPYSNYPLVGISNVFAESSEGLADDVDDGHAETDTSTDTTTDSLRPAPNATGEDSIYDVAMGTSEPALINLLGSTMIPLLEDDKSQFADVSSAHEKTSATRTISTATDDDCYFCQKRRRNARSKRCHDALAQTRKLTTPLISQQSTPVSLLSAPVSQTTGDRVWCRPTSGRCKGVTSGQTRKPTGDNCGHLNAANRRRAGQLQIPSTPEAVGIPKKGEKEEQEEKKDEEEEEEEEEASETVSTSSAGTSGQTRLNKPAEDAPDKANKPQKGQYHYRLSTSSSTPPTRRNLVSRAPTAESTRRTPAVVVGCQKLGVCSRLAPTRTTPRAYALKPNTGISRASGRCHEIGISQTSKLAPTTTSHHFPTKESSMCEDSTRDHRPSCCQASRRAHLPYYRHERDRVWQMSRRDREQDEPTYHLFPPLGSTNFKPITTLSNSTRGSLTSLPWLSSSSHAQAITRLNPRKGCFSNPPLLLSRQRRRRVRPIRIPALPLTTDASLEVGRSDLFSESLKSDRHLMSSHYPRHMSPRQAPLTSPVGNASSDSALAGDEWSIATPDPDLTSRLRAQRNNSRPRRQIQALDL